MKHFILNFLNKYTYLEADWAIIEFSKNSIIVSPFRFLNSYIEGADLSCLNPETDKKGTLISIKYKIDRRDEEGYVYMDLDVNDNFIDEQLITIGIENEAFANEFEGLIFLLLEIVAHFNHNAGIKRYVQE